MEHKTGKAQKGSSQWWHEAQFGWSAQYRLDLDFEFKAKLHKGYLPAGGMPWAEDFLRGSSSYLRDIRRKPPQNSEQLDQRRAEGSNTRLITSTSSSVQWLKPAPNTEFRLLYILSFSIECTINVYNIILYSICLSHNIFSLLCIFLINDQLWYLSLLCTGSTRKADISNFCFFNCK